MAKPDTPKRRDAVAKAAAPKKPTAKNVVAKKAAVKQASAKNAVAKKTVVKRVPTTRVLAKKSAVKKTPPTRRRSLPVDALSMLRTICLAFPEAHEVEAWGEPTFRVKNKIFAMHSSSDTHHGAGRQGVWINADHVTQDLLLRAKPTRYFKPPYVGPSGWVGAWLDGKPDWKEITELLQDGYRKRAPKKLSARLGSE